MKPLPLVTAIVSTYKAERFIRGCLEDLLAQTIASELEIIVIDSGSPQRESEICREIADRHAQVVLLRTEREPLYAAWNRAIGMARGKYLTNANTDDRHRSDGLERLAAALEAHPDVGLVYADQYISPSENETFDECVARESKVMRLPEFSRSQLLVGCLTGSQPMWRRAIHEEVGLFDLRYGIAADYDMWLRMAEHHPFLKVPGTLGVFYDSPNTLSGASNQARVDHETMAIQLVHLARPAWSCLPGIRKRLAAELFRRGYRHVEHCHSSRDAAPLLRQALRLDPFNFAFLKTYLLRGALGYRG